VTPNRTLPAALAGGLPAFQEWMSPTYRINDTKSGPRILATRRAAGWAMAVGDGQ
jgi:hypothetical protein